MTESRPHKAVSFVVERDNEIQECNEQKMPKVLPGYSGRRLPAGKEEKEEKDKNEESRIRNEIAQKVIEGIKERGKRARRCRITPTKNSRATCQAKLGLVANWKRRRGGGRLAKEGPG